MVKNTRVVLVLQIIHGVVVLVYVAVVSNIHVAILIKLEVQEPPVVENIRVVLVLQIIHGVVVLVCVTVVFNIHVLALI